MHRKRGSYGVEYVDLRELRSCMLDLLRRGNAMFDAFGITSAEAQASAASAANEMLRG